MLHHRLQEVVERFPENVALTDGDAALSYRELWERAGRVAAGLGARGVAPGDRVCLLAGNDIDAVTLFWAVLRRGAAVVHLNEQTPAEGLGRIVEDADPALIVATAALRASRLPFLEAVPDAPATVDLDALMDEASADPNPPGSPSGGAEPDAGPADADRIATIVYTSGSTGRPKGVCLTHRNLVAVAAMAGDGYATVPEDDYLMVVPLHYVHGLMILVTMHLRGAGIRFGPGFAFPRLVTRELQRSGVTGFSGVPYHFAALIERGGFLEAELPRLRWIGITGGRCGVERLAEIRAAQPGIEIHLSYGQTECSPRITALDPARVDGKPESVGRPAAGLAVEFLGEDGLPVAPGEVGELVVAGPTVMHGYWNDPESTARVVDERGRLHTGDLGYVDAEGDVFIRGRRQAMIKTAGERIFPEELEAILGRCPRVVDAAVVGVPDPLYGQRVEAHVVLDPDDEDALEAAKAHCLAHVPFARAPRVWHRWARFPLKANGKTDRTRLAAAVADGAGGRAGRSGRGPTGGANAPVDGS